MYSSAAAIFWMYNDSWPATCGWTIIDYYLRKKLSYHPVRRAFQPVTVVVAEVDDEVQVFGVNDTPEAVSANLRYGIVCLAGGYALDESLSVTLPANASTVLAAFPKAKWESAGLTSTGAFALLQQNGATVAQHRLFVKRFGELAFTKPDVRLERTDDSITLSSDVFAWGVCLDVDGDQPLADNCFDLLPGVPYTVAWAKELGEPSIKYVGSRDAVG
jgi:beta-mannosidase